MILYKDAFNGDEMTTDSFKSKIEGCMMVVEGKYVTKTEGDYGIASNADADAGEGAAGEGIEATVEKVIDVVDASKLMELSFTKSEYMAYIKGFLKRLKERVEKINPEGVQQFMADAQAFVKKVIGNFKNCSFYMGESNDTDLGQVVVAIYGEDGMTPYFHFWKDALVEERY